MGSLVSGAFVVKKRFVNGQKLIAGLVKVLASFIGKMGSRVFQWAIP